MGLLRRLFGPSQDEVWGQLAAQIGADFTPGGFFRESAVRAHVAATLERLCATGSAYRSDPGIRL